MLPSCAITYSAKRENTYAELVGNLFLVLRIFYVDRPNGSNLRVGQYGVPMLLSFWHSSFTRSILSIVFLCSKKQMIWSNAGWIVAMMQHAKSFWNWASVKNPTCSVSFHKSTTPPSNTKYSIPMFILGTNPQPTSLPENHFRPKTLWKSFTQSLRGKVLGGNLLHVSLVLPCGLLARAAFSFSQKVG